MGFKRSSRIGYVAVENVLVLDYSGNPALDGRLFKGRSERTPLQGAPGSRRMIPP
ncbi:hypothetical protein [Syntrophus sp. (in: bacteria)]|uniref:hypothetical protein n=1 Tax=Syntrophus sp. (in: bacteria) TaxID=48412 RepID=UPI00345EEA40